MITDTDIGQSRQFGFLRFSTVQEAEEFMDRYYPIIYIYGDVEKTNGDASKVRITFGRERKETHRAEDSDWTCSNVSHFDLVFLSQTSLTKLKVQHQQLLNTEQVLQMSSDKTRYGSLVMMKSFAYNLQNLALTLR